jgi:XRE family transcriptional regulator, aerobic/anaerobic benzoate catabolism transcriptional regulator
VSTLKSKISSRSRSSLHPLLQQLGERVRNLRAKRGVSRKSLARDAGVSERYLANLETGSGNASILLLSRVAEALALPLSDIVIGSDGERPDLVLGTQLLRKMSDHDLGEALHLLQSRFAERVSPVTRLTRIALIGLRGAGKSTLGKKLAESLAYRFVELDHQIEELSGMDAAQIHGMLGQSAYRRYELEALKNLLEQHQEPLVLATPGSIVSESETYSYLLAHCLTIWIKASPEEHMSRVIAQGDMRPMSGNPEAMNDLRRMLATREPLYAKADLAIDTTGRTVEETFESLRRAAKSAPGGRPSADSAQASSLSRTESSP